MRGLGVGLIVALVATFAIPFGVVLVASAALLPAVAEQIRIDPCSAYATSTADNDSLTDGDGANSKPDLPRWGAPRHQSLTSPAQQIPAAGATPYAAAAARYRVPWQLLAGIGMAETRHGRNDATSTAGAQGWMQFLPATFARYGVDGDGDGRAEIRNDADSIFSAAHYLAASGVRDGHAGVIRALWAYNRSVSYRNDVLFYAASYAGDAPVVPADVTSAEDCLPLLGGKLPGDGNLPGFDGRCPPSGSAAERGLQPSALRGLRCVKAAFRAIVSMGGRGGRPIGTSDHPVGLAVDFMIPKWSTEAGNGYGWKVAHWVAAHAKQLRVSYVLWDVKKWNPSAGPTWRPYTHPLGNRNATLAHRDHVHVSFHR